MKPLKIARVTNESGRLGLKKRRLWRMSSASLSTRKARMIATGQSNASSLQDRRQMDGPILLALSVFDNEAGMNWTKSVCQLQVVAVTLEVEQF
jgi:hypothetical protein